MGESSLPTARIRRLGGGRKPIIAIDSDLVPFRWTRVEEEDTEGDLASPLRWTIKRLTRLVDALIDQGMRVSPKTVSQWLAAEGSWVQVNCTRLDQGSDPSDHDQPFRHIADPRWRSLRGHSACGPAIIADRPGHAVQSGAETLGR